jgi:hypothetical protein
VGDPESGCVQKWWAKSPVCMSVLTGGGIPLEA